MALTFKEVAEILKLIDASQCDEVVLELEGTRLVVRRSVTGETTIQPGPTPKAEPTAEPARAAPTRSDAGSTSAAATPSVAPGLTDVRAPMVGSFYRRPSPDEPLFVEEGGKVNIGDPLCLIEVMKLFTTIEAPAAGTVVWIAPEDGTLVEYDQLLFQIQT